MRLVVLTGNRLAAILQHVLKQIAIGAVELVLVLDRLACWEGRVLAEPVSEIATLALDQMSSEALRRNLRFGIEIWIEQAQQRAERLVHSAMRGRRREDQVHIRTALHQSLEQLEAPMLIAGVVSTRSR